MKLATVATAAGVAYVLGWLTRQPEVAAARREANTDALTGLTNRRGLERQLYIRTERNQPYTIYLIDLNGFKPVNDTLGHRAGDQLLGRLAGRLSAQLAGHLVARLGGDEFVVLVAGPYRPGQHRLFSDRISRAVGAPVTLPGSLEPVTLTAAIGCVHAPCGADYRIVLHAADLAMYHSKRRGDPVLMTTPSRQSMDESPRSRIRDARAVRVA